MKQSLKYIAVIIGCATTLIIMARTKSCSDIPDNGESSVQYPGDSSFVPVVKQKYRPRSTPFEKGVKSPAPLPKDAPEANVARTVAIIKRIPVPNSAGFITDTTYVIIDKSNQIFVPKQSGIDIEVQHTEFVAPILEWDLFTSIGANISDRIVPGASLAPLKILGKVQFPSVVIDPQSIGLGAGYCYKEFVIGLSINKRFIDLMPESKLYFHYSL